MDETTPTPRKRRRYRTREIVCPGCEKVAMVRPGKDLCVDCGRKAAAPKPFEPTRRQRDDVWAAIALGCEIDELRQGVVNPATGRPIDGKTFRKVFADEVKAAKARFKLEVAGRLVRDMRRGKTTGTAIFFAKTVLGLRETSRHELTGKDGGPIETYDLSKLSDEQLETLKALAAAASGAGADPSGDRPAGG